MDPIFRGDYIDLKNLFFFIIVSLKKYSKLLVLVVLFFSVYYFFLKAPAYTSKVSFYTNYNESSQSGALSFIRSFTGDKFEQRLYLGFSVPEYINSDKFLEDVVIQKYNIDGEMSTLVDYWGVAYNDVLSLNPISTFKKINRRISLSNNLSIETKKQLLAKEVLRASIIHVEDPITSLHSLTVTVRKNDYLSQQIAQNMYNSIVKYSNNITNVKAVEKKNFVSERLNQAKDSLNNAENNLLLFLESNKNLASSPNLMLQRERLQRDIDLYDQLYITLSDQLEIAKINEKDNTSTVFILDSPYIVAYKAGRAYFESIIVLLLLFSTVFISFEAFLRKNELFLLKSQSD